MRKLPLRTPKNDKPKKEIKQKTLLDQVELCDRNGQHELDISKLSLSVWPNETVLVPSLRILNAEKNSLVSIPALDHFKALTQLNLSRNRLEDISEVRFGSIVALKTINLSHNALTHIPAEITRLTLLEELNISYNKLAALPEGMFQLKSLSTLDASFNVIVSVGDELESLNLLINLNLMGNDGLIVEEIGIRTRRLHEKVSCQNVMGCS